MNTSVPPHAPGDAPGTPPQQGDALDRFFATLRNCGLYRSDSERWIGGVCGGLAERLRVDPLIIRAAFVLLGLVFGAGLTVYLVAWILLPDRSGVILLQRAARGGDAAAVVLVAVVATIALSGFGLFWGWGGPGPIIPVLLVVGLLIYLLGKQNREDTSNQAAPQGWSPPPPATAPGPAAGESAMPAPHAPSTDPTEPTSRAVVPFGTAPAAAEVGSGSGAGTEHSEPQMFTATSVGTATPPGVGETTPPGVTPPPTAGQPAWGPLQPPPPPRPRRRRLGAGMTVVLIGLAAIIGSATTLITNATDLSDVAVRMGVAAAAVTIGVGVIIAGFIGRRAGFAAFLGLVLALGTAAGAAIPKDFSLAGPHGELRWHPTQVTKTSYTMGAGDGELDLRSLTAPTKPTTIRARVAVGELRILVPDDLAVRVKAHVDGGQITSRVLGSTEPTVGTGGTNRSRTFTFGPDKPAQPVLTVDADLGFGELIIERTPS